MEIYVSLFGEKKNVFEWLKLLEQEKIPFRYKGRKLVNFSNINILVGFPKRKIKKFLKSKNDKIYIIESNPIPSREKLIKAFDLLGFPYIHFWYYPTRHPSVFLFRIDVDYIEPEGLKELLEITKRYKIRGTYFINISGDEEFDEEPGFVLLKIPTTPKRKEILQRILNEDNELANHGYRHKVYNDFENNYKNIRKCSYYLKRLFGIKDQGFSSPGGEWNENLAQAISKNNFLYCSHIVSEIGDFPFYVSYNWKRTKILEIPFYEMNDGKFELVLKKNQNLKQIQKVSAKLKKDYLKYIEKQQKNNRPIAILGHPHLLGKTAKNVLPPIFKKISQLEIPNYTLKEFATWWRKREKFRLKYYKQNNKVTIYSTHPALIEVIFQKKKKVLWVDKKITITLE